MNSTVQVAAPPDKPLMIYDGDCNFCSLWIRRWQDATGDEVQYLASQDSQIAIRFPEISHEQLQAAVQLILPNGSVLTGAEAVFRSLAFNPRERWLFDLYQHSPVFARITEWIYGFVAGHRPAFSFLTRMFWGRSMERLEYGLVRWTFLRSLGLIYLIAFLSLWVQITGLIGRDGILPAEASMHLAAQQMTAAKIGFARFRQMPTLCWFSASDGFLKLQCAAGTALALLLLAGIAQAPCLFLLWLIYLSLASVGGSFLSFQWDNLLLETGFLALFFAPLQLTPRRPSEEGAPSRLALWLLRWLLFRLMFESGCVKLLSHDPTWRHLTALSFHYQTQPLPTWIGWYASQLPLWFQKFSTLMMFGIELLVPFLIFLPRRARQFACVAFLFLQILISLTGNYGFFNLLTMVLCLTLLDDAALRGFINRCWTISGAIRKLARSPRFASAFRKLIFFRKRADDNSVKPARVCRRWPAPFTLGLSALVLCTSFVQMFVVFRVYLPGPVPVLGVYQWLMPFRSFNSYGLFSVMTTTRREIVIEGSNDGIYWDAYKFKYKPDNLGEHPRFVAPYMPRLDWQTWFAALGNYQQNPWFVNFCMRLLQGSPEVLALMGHNPFTEGPPRYIRAVVYEYHFTDFATHHKTGNWWRRELKGVYLPPVSMR